MKECTNCKAVKSDEKFNRQKRKDGTYKLTSWCKKCLSDYKKQHYSKNKDKYLDRSRKRREEHSEEIQEYQREYYRQNKNELQVKSKEYSQTEEGKQALQRASKKYRESEQYQLKQNARKKVLRAVESGKLIKPAICESCGEDRSLEAHHEDYNKPLEVKWLCKECHENVHHLNEGHESLE